MTDVIHEVKTKAQCLWDVYYKKITNWDLKPQLRVDSGVWVCTAEFICHIRKFISRRHTDIFIHAFINNRLDHYKSSLWAAWFIHSQTPENPELLCPPYVLLLQILPRHTPFNETSLATCPTKNRLQTTSYHVHVLESNGYNILLRSQFHHASWPLQPRGLLLA